jgi:hypothetical protein
MKASVSSEVESSSQVASGPQREAFLFQLDILKMEIETINTIIGRMDEITQATKNWAVLTWAGGLAAVLGTEDLRKYIGLTAILPFVFWYADAHWRRLQRRSTFRAYKIGEFLNSTLLQKSFASGALVDFTVHDPIGWQYKGTGEYRDWVSIRRTLQFKEIAGFYGSLVLISLILGIYFAWVAT